MKVKAKVEEVNTVFDQTISELTKCQLQFKQLWNKTIIQWLQNLIIWSNKILEMTSHAIFFNKSNCFFFRNKKCEYSVNDKEKWKEKKNYYNCLEQNDEQNVHTVLYYEKASEEPI